MKVIFPRSDIARIVCYRIRTHFAKLSIDQKRFLLELRAKLLLQRFDGTC